MLVQHCSFVSIQGLHLSNTTADESSSFTLLCRPQLKLLLNEGLAYRAFPVFVTNRSLHHNAPLL